MMQRTLGILMALLLALTALCLPTGYSEAAGLQDGDFSCRGVAIGASEQELFKAWGEPLFDKAERRQGVTVKVFVYKDQYEAAVDKSGHVVDLSLIHI